MPSFLRSAAPASFDEGRATGHAITSRLWYRAVASRDTTTGKQLPLISDYFADALHFAGWPEGACLFMTGPLSSGPGGHGTVPAALFFSPAAIDVVPHLIAACRAEPGPPPDRAGATLLVGKLSDWTLLPYGQH